MTERSPGSLRAGARVVVRHLIEDGERATDTVGELLPSGPDELVVRGRHGDVRVRRADVVAAKPVPERPWRVAAFLRRAEVAVLDLDGVLREFDAGGDRARVERELGLEPSGLMKVASELPEARAVVRGTSTYAEWVEALRARLLDLGHPQPLVDLAVERWRADRGTPVRRTVDLVDELAGAGTPTYVFTNGTDQVPAELEQIGLGRLIPMLLNTHDLGFAKPEPQAYAAAHAEIERRLGRTVGRAQVGFTDDRAGHVDAARAFGWRGQLFTLPR